MMLTPNKCVWRNYAAFKGLVWFLEQCHNIDKESVLYSENLKETFVTMFVQFRSFRG